RPADDRGPRPERTPRPPRSGDRPDRGERREFAPRGERREGGPEKRDRAPREGGFERKGPREGGFDRSKGGFDRKGGPGGDRKPPVRSGPRAPQAGDWVEVVLLEERTKKGGWRAEHAGSKLSGPLVNTGMVPGEQNAGDKVELIIHSLNKFEMMFRWPTDAEKAKHEKQKK
ncbi:MAG: hypothetical protein ACAI44_11920, partial [Candidatus Sericytochromatia bacterium]